MRAAVNVLLACIALAATPIAFATAAADELEAQFADDRWVPSLAITSGATFQRHAGSQSSLLFDDDDPTGPTPLRETTREQDSAVAPYVGAGLELMTPAIPVFGRPRFFATAEILPTFAPERQLAQDGEPSRIRGPEIGAVLAVEETNTKFADPPGVSGPRQFQFGEREANGQGMRTNAQIDHLVFGAKAGVAFGFEWRGRQMRIKPSAGWIHYRLAAKGYLVDPTCNPITVCTDVYSDSTGATVRFQGNLRESILSNRDHGYFDGVGPGLDLEMDIVRFGPIGTSLFAGIHAYYIPGDRDIVFHARKTFDDAEDLQPGPPDSAVVGTGTDVHTATWRAEVKPWLYRAGLGIRFQWLGSGT